MNFRSPPLRLSTRCTLLPVRTGTSGVALICFGRDQLDLQTPTDRSGIPLQGRKRRCVFACCLQKGNCALRRARTRSDRLLPKPRAQTRQEQFVDDRVLDFKRLICLREAATVGRLL